MFKLYFLTRECFTRGDRKISPNGLIFALFSHPGINARKKKIQCRVPNSASRFTSARRVSRGVWDTRVLKHVVFVASNFVLFWKFKRIVFESSWNCREICRYLFGQTISTDFPFVLSQRVGGAGSYRDHLSDLDGIKGEKRERFDCIPFRVAISDIGLRKHIHCIYRIDRRDKSTLCTVH